MRVTVRSATPVAAAIRTGPARNRRRASTTRCSTTGLHRPGEERGREDLSTKPATPSSKKRHTHFRTVDGDTLRSRATRPTFSSSSTTRNTISKRPLGVNGALP